jgi:hypothetical protein
VAVCYRSAAPAGEEAPPLAATSWASDVSEAEEEEQQDAAAAESTDSDAEFETDPKRLQARQKQIDFGKNTIGYERYTQAVPK